MTTTPRLFMFAIVGVLAASTPSFAAWNNVFQVCCNDCNDRPIRSFFAPAPCPEPCPQPCPEPEMRVSYVQRCYYQRVTEYERRSYQVPVTRQVTSYYYEPVTTYRYSTYYDPCTGCPQRVCKPCTTYKLRSRCNSVTSFVERCAMVPVTKLKRVSYMQPVVSYYYPPQPDCPPAVGAPQVEQQRESSPSVVPDPLDTIPPPNVPTTPGMSNPRPGSNVRLRPEKTVSLSSEVTVRGEVTMPDQLTPRGNAKLVFINAKDLKSKEYVTANNFGEFDVRLKAGTWYLYLGGENGRATYHKKLELGDRDTYDYTVVSR